MLQMNSEVEEAQAIIRSGTSQLPFSPYRHATRALMYGTVLSFGCTSVGLLAIGYCMGVRNVRLRHDDTTERLLYITIAAASVFGCKVSQQLMLFFSPGLPPYAIIHVQTYYRNACKSLANVALVLQTDQFAAL